MNDWRESIPPAAIEAVTREVAARGLIGSNDRSVIFHDLERMRSRLRALAGCFPAHSLHAVAIKANPVIEILKEAVAAGAGLEAASFEEVCIARAAGASPQRIVFDSPAKTTDELAEALALGMIVNADNFDELERIDALYARMGSTSLVGLRINPMVGAGSIGITSVADGGSKFGVDIDSQRQRIRACFEQYAWLRGLHAHIGSQGCSLELLVAGAERLDALAREMDAAGGGNRLAFVDIGGGLSTAYRDEDTAPDIEEYALKLRQSVPGLFEGRLQLITEFGRALQAGCGFALSRVEYIKRLEGKPVAVVHLGADMLMRPVYLPEQWKHRFLVLGPDGKLKSGNAVAWTIAGPLCFAGDIVARDTPLPPIEVGDFIAVRDVGAYTLSMWSRHCSRGMPLVLGFSGKDGVRVLRRAETPEEVARFWSLDRDTRAGGLQIAASDPAMP